MDTITFLGPRIPLEVKKLLPIFQTVAQTAIQKMVIFVVEYVKGADISDEGFAQFAKSLEVDTEVLSTAFTGLFYILRAAVRTRVKLDVLDKDLQELKLPQFLITDLVKLLKQNQQVFENALINNKLRYPTLTKMNWRVDVAISSSTMSRVLKPSILMRMQTSDGNVKTFEVSAEKFSELRYNVAKVLKEMQEVEHHPVLKITK